MYSLMNVEQNSSTFVQQSKLLLKKINEIMYAGNSSHCFLRFDDYKSFYIFG